jgi:hypothetical protein
MRIQCCASLGANSHCIAVYSSSITCDYLSAGTRKQKQIWNYRVLVSYCISRNVKRFSHTNHRAVEKEKTKQKQHRVACKHLSRCMFPQTHRPLMAAFKLHHRKTTKSFRSCAILLLKSRLFIVNKLLFCPCLLFSFSSSRLLLTAQ